MLRQKNSDAARLAVYFPGQVIKAFPSIGTLGQHDDLEALVGQCHSTFENAVGKQLGYAELVQLLSTTVPD